MFTLKLTYWIVGYLRDVTGSYDVCFYTMGTCMLLGGVVILVEPLVLREIKTPRIHVGLDNMR